jgi:hypothetical protein
MLMTLTIYSGNLFNYINLSRADSSGMLRFFTDELQAAEGNGDRRVSTHPPCCPFTEFCH